MANELTVAKVFAAYLIQVSSGTIFVGLQTDPSDSLKRVHLCRPNSQLHVSTTSEAPWSDKWKVAAPPLNSPIVKLAKAGLERVLIERELLRALTPEERIARGIQQAQAMSREDLIREGWTEYHPDDESHTRAKRLSQTAAYIAKKVKG